MKKNYATIKAEKIDFGAYDMVTTASNLSGCMRIVSNVLNGTQGKNSKQCADDISDTSGQHSSTDD